MRPDQGPGREERRVEGGHTASVQPGMRGVSPECKKKKYGTKYWWMCLNKGDGRSGQGFRARFRTDKKTNKQTEENHRHAPQKPKNSL